MDMWIKHLLRCLASTTPHTLQSHFEAAAAQYYGEFSDMFPAIASCDEFLLKCFEPEQYETPHNHKSAPATSAAPAPTDEAAPIPMDVAVAAPAAASASAAPSQPSDVADSHAADGVSAPAPASSAVPPVDATTQEHKACFVKQAWEIEEDKHDHGLGMLACGGGNPAMKAVPLSAFFDAASIAALRAKLHDPSRL